MHGGATWAVLIASKPAEGFESPQLLKRARSVVFSDNICAIVAESHLADWRALTGMVTPGNLFTQRRGEATQAAIARMLDALSQRDARANLIVIPADHCSAEENAWVECAKNALRLGAVRADTVFVLHDKPENDPRTSPHYPGVCSSSVMIGSLQSIRDLCAGLPAIAIVDLDLDSYAALPAGASQATQLQSTPAPRSPALKVLHITSVDEYAKLQRGEYGRPRSRIDLHA